MVLKINLDSLASRVAVILLAVTVCGLLSYVVFSQFIIGVMGNPLRGMNREMIATAAEYFPHSARIQARLADREMAEIEGTDYESGVARAEAAATRAVNLSPWDYGMRLLLASAKEMKGDRAGAEQSLREALRLAPNYTEVHWRLANLLVREDKLDEAVGEFRATVASDSTMLPVALDAVWAASGGEVAVAEAVAGSDPATRLGLAQFLLKQSQAPEATRVFSSIDRQARLASPESGAFLDALIAAGQVELAHSLWADLVGSSNANQSVVWNGGFESEALKGLAQFDWVLGSSDYARVMIDPGVAHTGARSLRIDFAGRDTTRLDGEVKQLMMVRPGTSYRLECYVKTEGLVTPEGPRVVVTSPASSWSAASDPVAAGSNDWRQLTVDFTAPATSPILLVAVKRIPKFSYDDPTRGTLWLDDFVIKEKL